MKSGAFIPIDMYVEVRKVMGHDRRKDGTAGDIFGPMEKKKVLFCDVLIMGGRISLDKYYERNHAVAEGITEIELQAVPGFESYREGASAEMYRDVFEEDK
jgi:hypothetical protein